MVVLTQHVSATVAFALSSAGAIWPPLAAGPEAQARQELLLMGALLLAAITVLLLFIVYFGRMTRRTIRHRPPARSLRKDTWYSQPLTRDDVARGTTPPSSDGSHDDP